MRTEVLEKIGLTEGEAKVYLALLGLGESTIGSIIKEAHVSNSKVYDILSRLSKKGLVGSIVRNNTKYFQAAEPSRLKEFLRLKEMEIKLEKQRLEKMIPQLESIWKFSAPKQEAELFEGINGIKTFCEIVLNEIRIGDTFYILGVPKEANERMGAYFQDWHKRRVKKKINCRILYNADAKKWAERRKRTPHTKIKFLPKNIVTPAFVDIGADYVATIIFSERPLCFVIKNRKIYESYVNYFELLWKIAY